MSSPPKTCPSCGQAIGVAKPPALDSLLATEKQKAFAQLLGIDFPANISKWALSELITAAQMRPYEESQKMLDELADRGSKVYQEMQEEFRAEADEDDSRLSKATVDQMLKELEYRDKGAVLISFNMDAGNFNGAIFPGAELSISFSENLSKEQMTALLIQMATSLVEKRGGRLNVRL